MFKIPSFLGAQKAVTELEAKVAALTKERDDLKAVAEGVDFKAEIEALTEANDALSKQIEGLKASIATKEASIDAEVKKQVEAQVAHKLLVLNQEKGTKALGVPEKKEGSTLSRADFDKLSDQAKGEFFKTGGKLVD